MTKSIETIDKVQQQMRWLYYGQTDIDDCFLSAKDGKTIVGRWGQKARSRTEKLVYLMKDLRARYPKLIFGCDLLSVDGLTMASIIARTDGDETELPRYACLTSISQELAKIFGMGAVEFIRISGNNNDLRYFGDIVLTPVGDEAILATMLRGSEMPHEVLEEIKETCITLNKFIWRYNFFRANFLRERFCSGRCTNCKGIK